jgi:hypothetical protein
MTNQAIKEGIIKKGSVNFVERSAIKGGGLPVFG